MKLGLIADIHGNHLAFKRVLNVLLNEVDRILFLGDLCGHYPFVEECVSLWDKRIVGVRGNHDQIFLDCASQASVPPQSYRDKYGSALSRSLSRASEETLALVKSWPVSQNLELGAGVACFHGAPWDPLGGRVYPDFKGWDRFNEVSSGVIAMGQTHYPFIKRHGDKLIINPGSVGQPRDIGNSASYATVDVESDKAEIFRVPFDPAELIEDARQHNAAIPYLCDIFSRT
ncbi:MAG: YfcE family phosphodiesterase [Elusimicrobia bacterium]|nr:YfcE family phosphodiesterase [Elusimicrobiota bacterium]